MWGALEIKHNLREALESRSARHALSLCHDLLSDRGDVSGATIAAEALATYQALSDTARERFFDDLVSAFSPNAAQVEFAAKAYSHHPSPAALTALQAAVESPRQELLRRLNLAPGGIRVLIRMREQVLRALESHPHRSVLDDDLRHLFRSWFNRGFLVLKRIDWQTPADVLERLIEYEAVHQIQGWTDLRRRLQADRRCYAFFHLAMPDDPLIFIEVALTRDLGGNVQPLLDPRAPVTDPARAKCAMFYSITNCHDGLRAVSFGNFLIKQVVALFSSEFPRIRTCATLSPIPGFGAWLRTEPAVAAHLKSVASLDRIADLATASPTVKAAVMRACAWYLLHAKRGKAPLDSVARFHLANGARLHRLNWLGDTSAVGMQRGLGMTANYVYRIADVERNHQKYVRDFTVVASSGVERLARNAV